jgi:hypothetical protein
VRGAITDIRTGEHPGYDRLVVEFSGPGVPPYRIDPHDVSTFSGDFTGLPVAVAGNAALRLHLENQDIPVDLAANNWVTPGYGELRQVVMTGDFEGIANIAIGLDHPTYPIVTVMANPARLVIDFPTGS